MFFGATGGDDMPTPSAVDSARHLEQIGWSLSRAGISSGAWLLARASYSAPAASKKFTLAVNGENEYGEIMSKNLDITISTLEELKEVKYDNGRRSYTGRIHTHTLKRRVLSLRWHN